MDGRKIDQQKVDSLMASTSNNRGVVYKGAGKVEVEGIDFPKLVNPKGKQAEHGVILKVVAVDHSSIGLGHADDERAAIEVKTEGLPCFD